MGNPWTLSNDKAFHQGRQNMSISLPDNDMWDLNFKSSFTGSK
jgi:hypothetical protein